MQPLLCLLNKNSLKRIYNYMFRYKYHFYLHNNISITGDSKPHVSNIE